MSRHHWWRKVKLRYINPNETYQSSHLVIIKMLKIHKQALEIINSSKKFKKELHLLVGNIKARVCRPLKNSCSIWTSTNITYLLQTFLLFDLKSCYVCHMRLSVCPFDKDNQGQP